MDVENKENVRAVENQNIQRGFGSAKDRALNAEKITKDTAQKAHDRIQQEAKQSLGEGQGQQKPIQGEILGEHPHKQDGDIANADWNTLQQKNKEMALRRPQLVREAGQEAFQEGLEDSVEAYQKGRQAHKQNRGKKAAVAPQAFDATKEHDKPSVDITSKNAQFTYDPKGKKGRGKTSREHIQDKAQELSSAMTHPGKRDHEAFIQGKAGEAFDQMNEEDFTGGQEKKKADLKKNKEAFGQVLQDITGAGQNLQHSHLDEQQMGGFSQQDGGLQQGQRDFTDGTENFHGPKGDAEFMETEDQTNSEMQGIGTGFGSMQQAGAGGEQLNVKDTMFNTGMQQGGVQGGASSSGEGGASGFQPPRI